MSSVDFSLSSLNPIGPVDLTANLNGASDATRIKQVSKAMESLFVNQLTAEMGKSIDGSDDSTGGQYGDFIQQALTQGVTQGGGFGLAKIIEGTLTHASHDKPVHMPLKTPNNSYHVNHVD
jgi:Rod binding domain-containing protein